MIPLSFAQRRLWFLGKLDGPSPTYNIPVPVRLAGEVDAVALNAALRDVLGRHESLRTVFPAVDGEPYQHILDLAELDWELEVRQVAADQLGEAAGAPLPVRLRPVVRGPPGVALRERRHRRTVDAGGAPHRRRRLVDGRSGGTSPRRTRRGARAGRVGPLPVQYADYTLWQRELLGDERPGQPGTRQLDYWRGTLAGAPEELACRPTARARPRRATPGTGCRCGSPPTCTSA